VSTGEDWPGLGSTHSGEGRYELAAGLKRRGNTRKYSIVGALRDTITLGGRVQDERCYKVAAVGKLADTPLPDGDTISGYYHAGLLQKKRLREVEIECKVFFFR